MTNEKIDRKTFDLIMNRHSSKSHTIDDLYDAYLRGEEIYVLDSGPSGHDDVLIGTYDECIDDLIDYYDWVDWDGSLPMGWSLAPLSDYIAREY